MSATAVGKWTFFLNERPRVACDISLSGRSCVEINSHKSKCKVNYMTCVLRVPDAFPPAPQFGLVSCFVDLQVRTTKTYSYLRSMRYIKRIQKPFEQPMQHGVGSSAGVNTKCSLHFPTYLTPAPQCANVGALQSLQICGQAGRLWLEVCTANHSFRLSPAMSQQQICGFDGLCPLHTERGTCCRFSSMLYSRNGAPRQSPR